MAPRQPHPHLDMESSPQPHQYSQYRQYNPTPIGPPEHGRRGVNWPAIFIALLVLIIILGLAVLEDRQR